MRWRLPLLSKQKFASAAAILLSVLGPVFAQEMPAPPIPIWSGEGSVPAGSGNRKVFLSPDEHSVIILWPNFDGTEKMRRFDLHNTIFPDLRVHMEGSSGSFRYRYDLENGKESKDSLRDFFVVIYPDPQMQTNSTLWKGGLSLPTVKERVGIPGAPPGRLVDWMCCLDGQGLSPGGDTNFTLNTEARPGFTSASTEHFPHLDLTDEWPEEILDQLGPVLDPKWIAHHFITLGPRYGPDDPATRIASDYIVGIQELIRIHRLESNSPFMKEVIADLDAISAGSSTQIPITQKPHSEMEAEILNALQLSLHVTYNGPQ
ncbi:MAG: hypothetical protein ABR920_09765 [Terriglobales bacterium]